MDVTPELIDVALYARRETMALTTFRKVERPGTSAVWTIIESPQVADFAPMTVDLCNVHRFTYERQARAAYESIIMRGVLNAVANHLVKDQSPSPSQAD